MGDLIEYEGLRELVQALNDTDHELLDEVEVSLERVGNVVRDDARSRFEAFGDEHGKPQTFARTAEGFESRVRVRGTAQAVLVVAQRMRSSRDLLRRRPLYGSLEMRKALLPARAAKLDEAAEVLERDVVSLLHRHGF